MEAMEVVVMVGVAERAAELSVGEGTAEVTVHKVHTLPETHQQLVVGRLFRPAPHLRRFEAKQYVHHTSGRPPNRLPHPHKLWERAVERAVKMVGRAHRMHSPKGSR